jgi:hypothetical protein
MAEVLIEANQQPTTKQPIIENAVYSREEAIAATGFSLSTFIRAEKKGLLHVRRQGRRVYMTGSDLWRWLNPEKELAK